MLRPFQSVQKDRQPLRRRRPVVAAGAAGGQISSEMVPHSCFYEWRVILQVPQPLMQYAPRKNLRRCAVTRRRTTAVTLTTLSPVGSVGDGQVFCFLRLTKQRGGWTASNGLEAT